MIKHQSFWITPVRANLYFTKNKPDKDINQIGSSGVITVIQDFTDVAELKELFGLEGNSPKCITLSESQETVVNG